MSPYYKDGTNHPRFTIKGVQIRFTNAQSKIYGTFYSEYFDCNETPTKVANKILEEKKEKELKEEGKKISYLPENSLENIDAKINRYKSLAQKYQGKSFKNEIIQLEQKKNGKINESKAKMISQLPENTIDEIDKKVNDYPF